MCFSSGAQHSARLPGHMSCRQRPAALVHQRTASVKRTRVSFKSVGEAELETNEVYFSLEAQTSRTATAVDVVVNAIVDAGACCGPHRRLVMTAVDATACCGRIPQASLRIQDSAADHASRPQQSLVRQLAPKVTRTPFETAG